MPPSTVVSEDEPILTTMRALGRSSRFSPGPSAGGSFTGHRLLGLLSPLAQGFLGERSPPSRRAPRAGRPFFVVLALLFAGWAVVLFEADVGTARGGKHLAPVVMVGSQSKTTESSSEPITTASPARAPTLNSSSSTPRALTSGGSRQPRR